MHLNSYPLTSLVLLMHRPHTPLTAVSFSFCFLNLLLALQRYESKDNLTYIHPLCD